MGAAKRRILITGASGLLGGNLLYYYSGLKDTLVYGCFNTNPVVADNAVTFGLDLADEKMVEKKVAEIEPKVVIHCAARTDLDALEHAADRGWRDIVLTTRNLVASLEGSRTKLVYISTDSVYPGETGPYAEDTKPAPRNRYGRLKLESEQEVRAGSNALILRTNIFGWNIGTKISLAEWFLNELKSRGQARGYRDVFFSPIYTMFLAELIEDCLARNLEGLFNCAGRDSMSKYEFGKRVVGLFGYRPEQVIPFEMESGPDRGPRGKDLRMDMTLLEKKLVRHLPTIDQSLTRFYEDHKAGLPEKLKSLAAR